MTGYFKEIPPYYENQKETLEFIKGRVDAGAGRVFDASDPGTGKTRPAIGAFVERRKAGGGKALVLAPKSILQPAWGDDIGKFFPGTSYVCAYATNRAKAFALEADIYVTNHDAVSWLIDKNNLPKNYWSDFDTIIIDESTAYKNPQAKRSKAARKLAKLFEYREIMTGTPNPNSVTEFWHQVMLLDDGEALGTSFWGFRSAVCEPVRVGPGTNHIKWVDKQGAEEVVYDLIEDMTIRHPRGECPHYGEPYRMYYDLPRKARKKYGEMVDLAVTLLDSGELLQATQASTVHQKLMQMASGGVYKGHEKYEVIDTGRYELVMDLAEEREQCLIGFIWRHQRDEMIKIAKKRKLTYASIDGETSDKARIQIVRDFQAGKIKVLFAHPQSAGHGLTLTSGTTCIWASPTYNAEHFKQFNARINRSGQEKQTETILVCGRNTIDEKVYDKLDGKLTSMELLLDLLGDKDD